MTGFGQALVSSLNFLILMFILVRFLVPATRQFMYARSVRIRKGILSSIMSLMRVRARLADSRKHYDELPKDISARRTAIAEGCKRECEIIVADARFKADHLIDGATRLAQEDRAKAEGLVKMRLLKSAFELAKDDLTEMAKADGGKSFAKLGLEQLQDLPQKELS